MKRLLLLCLLLVSRAATAEEPAPLDAEAQLQRIERETLAAVRAAEATGLKDRHLVAKMGTAGAMFSAAEWDLGVLAIASQAQARGGPGSAVVVRGWVGGTLWQGPTATDPGKLGTTSITDDRGVRLLVLTRYPVPFGVGQRVEVVGYRTAGLLVRGQLQSGTGATEAPVAAIAVLRAGSLARLRAAYPGARVALK